MKCAWLLGVGLIACSPVKGTPPGLDPDAPPVDPCEGVTCECTAATEDADCGAHAVCNEAGPGRVCECVGGYAEQSGACVFIGAPLDRGFIEADKWLALDATSTINAAATGNLDPGEGVIDRAGVCGFGGFKQTFTMPPRDKAEPFKLNVTHSIVDTGFTVGGGVDIGVGDAWFEAGTLRNQFKTDSFCLGSRAYDGPIDFRVQTTGNFLDCAGTSTATYNIDQVSVVQADDCPADGTAVNGDFSLQSDWVFQLNSGATGVFVATGGEGNTAAAQIAQTTLCSGAQMTGTVALDDHNTHPNQAIEVFVNGTNTGRLVVSLAGKEIGTITASGAGKKFRLCVPRWAHGTHASLTFLMQASQSGTCAASTKSFIIDSVEVVDEPNCQSVDNSDLGFERIANATGPVSGWGLRNDFINDVEGGISQIVNSGVSARTGNGSLRLSTINECTSDPSARAAFIAPAASGANGPAIKLHSNISAANTPRTIARASVFSGNRLASEIDLPENSVYTESILCIPPALSGRRLTLQIALKHIDGSTSCVGNFSQEIGFFDDVEITTDASCPAQ
jgi:hypothetical protein